MQLQWYSFQERQKQLLFSAATEMQVLASTERFLNVSVP